MALEPLSAACVEYLLHHRVLARQLWRATEPHTSLAIKAALHKYDAYPTAERNLTIILEPIIESIEDLLDSVMPYRTMDVYTVERSFSELVLTNHGDYRAIKFMEENPEWTPTSEEPENLVLSLRGSTNFHPL